MINDLVSSSFGRLAEPPVIMVLGLGNVLWADEGFGVRCVEALQSNWLSSPAVEFVDGGTQGLYLTPYVNRATHLIIFDAVDFGWVPGTMKMIRGDEVPAYLGAKKMSLHQTGFQEVLALARLMGQAPDEIILIGCQPQDLSDYGGSLTAVVKAQIPNAVNLAVRCLQDWGVVMTPHQLLETNQTIDALSMDRYESERPSADSACRIGDERILIMRQQAQRDDQQAHSSDGSGGMASSSLSGG